MDEGSRRSYAARVAPLALVIGLVVGVVAGYNLRPTAGIASSPAAKNCPKTTGTPVGAAHYTPGPGKGAATPLPHATPVPKQPHLILGMITRPLSRVSAIQAAADAKKKGYRFYLVPNQVVTHTLPQYGFKPPVSLVSPAKPFPRYAGRPVRKAIVKYQGKLYQVRVAQPGRQGKTGIWLIVTILPQTVHLGGIAERPATVARVQHLADTKKRYAFRLDPNQVVVKDAAQYGLAPPFKLLSKAVTVNVHTGRPTKRAVLSASGTPYDVYVAQFGKTGPKGVWLYAYIDVHQP